MDKARQLDVTVPGNTERGMAPEGTAGTAHLILTDGRGGKVTLSNSSHHNRSSLTELHAS